MKYWCYLVDTEMISIKGKFPIILIILFLMFKHFLKTNNRARKNYSCVLFTAHKDGEKFTLLAHLCVQAKIIDKILETNSSFHVKECTMGKISVFQEFFTSIKKIFISAGGLGTRLLFYKCLSLS